MAVYLKSLSATAPQTAFAYDDATAQGLRSNKPRSAGAALYLGACGACHGADGKGQPPFMPPLAGNPAVLDDNPASLINLVLNGAEPLVPEGVPGRLPHAAVPPPAHRRADRSGAQLRARRLGQRRRRGDDRARQKIAACDRSEAATACLS